MKIPRLIKEELDKSGVPFKIERGSRHCKIFIGEVFCGIFPLAGGDATLRRADLNVRSQIRRQVRVLKGSGNGNTLARV